MNMFCFVFVYQTSFMSMSEFIELHLKAEGWHRGLCDVNKNASGEMGSSNLLPI